MVSKGPFNWHDIKLETHGEQDNDVDAAAVEQLQQQQLQEKKRLIEEAMVEAETLRQKTKKARSQFEHTRIVSSDQNQRVSDEQNQLRMEVFISIFFIVL